MPNTPVEAKDYFNPETGQRYSFTPSKTPPEGWKPLKPAPDRDAWLPKGSTVTYIPGQEPQLYADPDTGESKWIDCDENAPHGWIRLVAGPEPPMTGNADDFFDPNTGHWFRFGPGLTAPPGWKSLGPIPAVNPGAPACARVKFGPGQEPRLFVDPEKGTTQWVYLDQAPPAGWKQILLRMNVPALTVDDRTYVDSKSGELKILKPGAKPPESWVKLKPVPPQVAPLLPPGTMIEWLPGMEPKLFVNPKTGESQWIFPLDKLPEGLIPLGPAWPEFDIEDDVADESDEDDEEDFDDREWLRQNRILHLITLARERGVDYIPEGDVADDDTYEREMARLGYTRDPDPNSPSGWIDTPPPPSDWDWLKDMGPIDRLYWVIDQLIRSGKLGQDFIDNLPNPWLLILGLLALFVLQFIPGVDILLDLYLIYQIGSQFFDLLDAVNAIVTAENEEQLRRAMDEFGKVLAGIGLDVLLALATAGVGKLKKILSAGRKALPRLPKKIEGLLELLEHETIKLNGGHGGKGRGFVPYEEYYPESPRGPRGREPVEKLPHDLELGERTPGRERARSRPHSLRPHGHHQLPQYLGGPYEQVLRRMRPYTHEQYHRELDQIVPRKWGSDYFDAIRRYDPELFREYMRKVLEHARKWDRRYPKHGLERAIREALRDMGWIF